MAMASKDSTEIVRVGAHTLAVVGHVGPDFSGAAMDEPHALAALAALGQATRLAIFRLLVRKEPQGMTAGTLAETVGCPHNTLSTHVAILARAGLVYGTREGRTITYRADAAGTRALIDFLVTDCCEGRPEMCGLSSASERAACECPPAAPLKKNAHRKATR
jgi:DNA-binding transcriptional ArsR family regulator